MLQHLFPCLPARSTGSLCSSISPQQLGVPLCIALSVCLTHSLSSNTCCRRSASLLSDDAESSPPLSSLSVLPSLFCSLPRFPFLTCMPASVFLSGFIPRQAQTLSSRCFLLSLPAKSPLCFSVFLPLFLIIYDQDVSIQVLSVTFLCIFPIAC